MSVYISGVAYNCLVFVITTFATFWASFSIVTDLSFVTGGLSPCSCSVVLYLSRVSNPFCVTLVVIVISVFSNTASEVTSEGGIEMRLLLLLLLLLLLFNLYD